MICKRHCERDATIHKQGFTLMELLIYMAIVGIVVVVAGQAFSNSTKFRVRTDNMIRATQEAENVGMLFKTDAEQLGTKNAKESGAAGGGSSLGDNFGIVHENVYMDPANNDYSSFLVSSEGAYSDFTFRRLRYDANGYYAATEEIHWYVENKALKRTCRFLSKGMSYTRPDDDPCADVGGTPHAIEMATGVDTFLVVPATPSEVDSMVQIFPPDGEESFRLISRSNEGNYVAMMATNMANEANKGGTGAILSKFYSNFDNTTEALRDETARKLNQVFAIRNETTAGDINWKNLCSQFGRLVLVPRQEYELSFKVAYPGTTQDRSLLFVSGTDHMSVGFRNIATGKKPEKGSAPNNVTLVDDFMFSPPLTASGAGTRTLRFRVQDTVSNVCLAFTFACYSPLVSQGKVTIQNLKLKKVATSDYKFPEDAFDAEANKTEKKNVKALKLRLRVSRGAKGDGKGETGDVSIVIPIPSNGPRD